MGIKSEFAAGVGFGCVLFSLFSSYGLALWYDSILVADDGLSRGNVINIVFVVLTGGG